MGQDEVLLQCDQEPSISAVMGRIVERRRSETLVRETPRRSHQSMGGDERWNQMVQEEFRALRGQLERDTGLEIKPYMPVCAWIVRHAAWAITRYQPQRARGGLTAYARIRGRPYCGKIVQLGERVMVYTPQDSSGKGPKRSNKS